MSEGIKLEVIGSHNERYPAQFHSFVNENEIQVKFEEKPEIICKLPIKIVHLAASPITNDLTVDSSVLIYQHVDYLNTVFNENIQLEHAWWPGKIAKLKGCFAAVNFDHQKRDSQNSDIVELVNVRQITSTTPISQDVIHCHEMKVPEDLCEFCENYDLRSDLSKWCGSCFVLNFDKTKKVLQINSVDSEVIRRASLLDASFMRVLRQKKLIHLQKAELTKRLQDSIRNNHIEQFMVAEELMGLAIGSQGSNIKKARELPGVISIELDDSTHTFTITAETQEIAKEARNQLEYMKKIYYVPEEIVPKIIGRNGNQIQDIIDQSGVMRVRVAKQPDVVNWSIDEENRHLLVDHVPFIFVGNSNSIRDACLLLEFTIDHHREMERLQRERDEIHREIRQNKNSGRRYNSQSEDESGQYSANSNSGGNYNSNGSRNGGFNSNSARSNYNSHSSSGPRPRNNASNNQRSTKSIGYESGDTTTDDNHRTNPQRLYNNQRAINNQRQNSLPPYNSYPNNPHPRRYQSDKDELSNGNSTAGNYKNETTGFNQYHSDNSKRNKYGPRPNRNNSGRNNQSGRNNNRNLPPQPPQTTIKQNNGEESRHSNSLPDNNQNKSNNSDETKPLSPSKQSSSTNNNNTSNHNSKNSPNKNDSTAATIDSSIPITVDNPTVETITTN